MSLARAISSGVTTIEGGGTVPPPPAVAGTWLSGLGYWTMRYGVLWMVGYQGTLTPPAGTDTDHITSIRISRIVSGQRAVLLSLAGPFPVGTGRGFKSDAIDVIFSGPVTLEFVTENEDGSTATFTTTVTLTAPSEASITAAEATPISTTRHQTENRGVRSVLNFTPVVNNPLWPLVITVWTNHPGSVRKHRAVLEMQGPGQIQLGVVGTKWENDIIPPTVADESWTVTYAIGSYDEQTAPPSSAKTSTAFTMAAISAPGATDGTAAYVDAVTYAQGSGGAYNWGWGHAYLTLPSWWQNGEQFMFARLYLETGKLVGGVWTTGGANPATADRPYGTSLGDFVSDTDHAERMLRVAGTNQIYCFNPNVWQVPSDGWDRVRLRWVIASRRDDGTGATKVLQSCWSSGVGVSTPGTATYQEVVIDTTKAQTDARQIDSTTLGAGFVRGSDGKPKLNSTNLSNLLYNGGFEEASLIPWQKINGTEFGWQSTAFAYSGSSYFTDGMNSNGGIKQSGISCRAGDEFFLEAYVNAGFGTISASVFISLTFTDASGAGVGSPYTGIPLTSGMGWTKVALTGTAPAGASSVQVTVQIGTASGTGNWYVDSVKLTCPTAAGAGLERDTATGGVKWKPGRGQKIAGDGSAELDLGANLDFDGSNRPIVKNGTLGEAVFVGSSLGQDLSKWDSAKRPFGFYSGLPSAFDSNVPKTIINMAETPWRVYTNISGTWTSLKTQPGDLVAGAITALVSLTSPSISGGSISGTSFSCSNANGSVTIDTTNFLRVLNSSGWEVVVNWLGLLAKLGTRQGALTPFSVSVANGSALMSMTELGIQIQSGGYSYNSAGVNGQFVIPRFPSGSAVVTVVNGVIISIV